jgi:hypothetical protein
VRSGASNPSAPFTVPDEIFAIITQDITTNRTFHADTTYVLSGFIKVANQATLTIEPGTKIVGDFEVPGSSLFVRFVAGLEAQDVQALEAMRITAAEFIDLEDAEGPNRIHGGCTLDVAAGEADVRTISLFGQILERDGTFKFVNYANGL